MPLLRSRAFLVTVTVAAGVLSARHRHGRHLARLRPAGASWRNRAGGGKYAGRLRQRAPARGARAVRPENTLAGFRYALANRDISTLEPDTGVTADGELVVIHDRTVNGSHCVDTAPVSPGDALFPYVGKRVHQLTLRQLKTIDCGTRTVAEFPRQVAVPGERIPTLREVFAAVRASGRTDVRLNIETKISPTVPDTADYRVFTGALVTAIKDAGYLSRATIQSFDWSPAYFHGPTVPRLRERYGLKVIPYPVNDAAIMQRLIDLRVDGIITDDPDLLVLVARRNGLR